MAKGILRFFGALAIICGAVTILFGLIGGLGAFIVVVPIGAGFLISGAPLLGFAYVIELLEEIARNTKGTAVTSSLRGSATTEVPRLELLQAGKGPQPRQGDHGVGKPVLQANYRGQDYRAYEGGMVTARLADGPCTWESISAFRQWTDARLNA